MKTKNSKTNYIRPTRRVIRALKSLGRTSRTALAKATALDTDGLKDALKRLAKRKRVTVSDRFISLGV